MIIPLQRAVAAVCLAAVTVFTIGAAPVASEADPRRDLTVSVVERVLPTAVNIATAKVVSQEDGWLRFWNPYHRQRPPQSVGYSAGSGVFIDETGYVLSNEHVVAGTDKIWVNPANSTNIFEAVIVGTDARADLALLKIQGQPGEKFPAIPFAQDDDLLLGETVLAIGNPFTLGGSVSRGILSSKSRAAPGDAERLDVPNWLQTDASINPGNSGGPLVNLRGELIGVNVAKTAMQGIGFAIPVKQVVESLSAMVTPENSNRRLWFGARVRAGGPALTVLEVAAGSPASQAGLRVGDDILEVNGKKPSGFVNFEELLANSQRPDVSLTVRRDGRPQKFTVRMVPLAEVFNAVFIRKKLGLTLQALTPQLARSLGVSGASGFVIANVDPDVPEGLTPGLLVTTVDGQRPADLVAAARLLEGKQPGQTVQLGLILQQQRGNLVTYREAVVELPVRRGR